MPFTSNLVLETPLRGSYVGVWDTPVNANWGLLDSAMGATATVDMSAGNVTLSAAQYQCGFIVLTGTLTTNRSLFIPAGLGRFWVIYNGCSGNTTYSVNCGTGSPTSYVGLPPNETIMIQSDGTSTRYVGLDRVGTYWDFAGSAIPIWITNSNPPPYLNCDGSVFASSTYPVLASYLGGTTLPDSRGRFRGALNQGTGRLTGTLDGNTILSGGGSQTITQANLPNVDFTVTDPGHTHDYLGFGAPGNFASGTDLSQTVTQVTYSATTRITVNSGGSGTGYAPPGYIGGLTLIRAG